MGHVNELRTVAPVERVCAALSLPRSTYYARSKAKSMPKPAARPRARPARALSENEQQQAIAVLTSDEYVDKSPAAVVADLLRKGIYICSVRTFYRLLGAEDLVHERREITRHVTYSKPELVATAPRQVFTWDITKIKGPRRGEVYNCYVIEDIFSRYIVGWMISHREKDTLARQLFKRTCEREGITDGQLIVHSDNGSSMRSKTVADLFEQLKITKSHSRPSCSNDNPYIESFFKTMKYLPDFPERFDGIEHVREYMNTFVDIYNNHMYHSGIAMLTPATVHFGEHEVAIQERQIVLDKAYSVHPERFVNGRPKHPQLPKAVYINKPTDEPIGTLNS